MGAHLLGAVLIDADLRKVDLKKADLSGANLYDAVLLGSDLSEAIMIGVNWNGADLNNCILTSSSARLADFSNNKTITQNQLETIFGVKSGLGCTLIPDSLEYPDFWHAEPDGELDSHTLKHNYDRAYRDWLSK